MCYFLPVWPGVFALGRQKQLQGDHRGKNCVTIYVELAAEPSSSGTGACSQAVLLFWPGISHRQGNRRSIMAYFPYTNSVEQPDEPQEAASSASLIHVPASEQMAPGAFRRCPVCGMSYALGGQVIAEPSLEASSTDSAAETPAQPAETTERRVVLRCAYCGTYSVGVPGK